MSQESPRRQQRLGVEDWDQWRFSPMYGPAYMSVSPSLTTGKKRQQHCLTARPYLPICQVLLRPSELQEHMEQELEQLAQLPAR